jgi:hypothetical protein
MSDCIDSQLEWTVLANVYAGYLPIERVSREMFSDERRLTFARMTHGTLCEWEIHAFDLVPVVAASQYQEMLDRLIELNRRRRLVNDMAVVDEGVRHDTLSCDEACNLLAQALEKTNAATSS